MKQGWVSEMLEIRRVQVESRLAMQLDSSPCAYLVVTAVQRRNGNGADADSLRSHPGAWGRARHNYVLTRSGWQMTGCS